MRISAVFRGNLRICLRVTKAYFKAERLILCQFIGVLHFSFVLALERFAFFRETEHCSATFVLGLTGKQESVA